MSEKILITSALTYANGRIHMGHVAGSFLCADIFARHNRLLGRNVLYICGTDEHGVPITLAAEKEGISPQEVVDRYHGIIREGVTGLGISYDIFSRTTIPEHYESSREFFLRLFHKGFIESMETGQFYCEKCARFLPDRYVEGKCPHCGAEAARGDQCETCGKWFEQKMLVEPSCQICRQPPVLKKTRHWFLMLNKFQEPIEKWIRSKENWKENVRNFCLGWLKEGLKERSITRDMSWGVPVPLEEAKNKVLYVWFDAPIGYISFTKRLFKERGDPDGWMDYWKNENCRLYHFIGKDNIVFHAVVWPAMLMGQDGYILPENIPAMEFLNFKGRKFSTSKNWAVWVEDYLKHFPPDLARFYLTLNGPETRDTNFTWEDFIEKVNSQLADIIGNFIYRTLSFTSRYLDGKVPEERAGERILQLLGESRKTVSDCIERFSFRDGLKAIVDLAREGNKFFNDEEPWVSRKKNPIRCRESLAASLEIVAGLSLLLAPYLPFTSEALWKNIGMGEPVGPEEYGKMGERILHPGQVLPPPAVPVSKIDEGILGKL